jgi:prepilin-type processing-associated H-X9-DG protein
MPPLEDVPLLILAGGRATRLGSLADDTPKFLMPVDEGRRFADVQLDWARSHGLRQVVLSVGYRGEEIRAYVGDGQRHGLQVRYSFDGPHPLGTGGAVKRAFPRPPPLVIVTYGDTILELDVNAAVQAIGHQMALMTIIETPSGHRANATFVDGHLRYDKQRAAPDWRWLDYGLLVLSDRFLRELPDTTPLDLAQPLHDCSTRDELAAFRVARPFFEINTPEALEAFRRRFGKQP